MQIKTPAKLTYGTAHGKLNAIDATTGKASIAITKHTGAATSVGDDTAKTKGTYKADSVTVNGKTYKYVYDMQAENTNGDNFTKDIALAAAKGADANTKVFESEEDMLAAIKKDITDNLGGEVKSVSTKRWQD